MSEVYQATYDAIRSKVSGGDIGDAVRAAVENTGLSHMLQQACQEFTNAAFEMQRPSTVYKPSLVKFDGNWYAQYNPVNVTVVDLNTNLVGLGKSPEEAMYDFDKKWRAKIERV